MYLVLWFRISTFVPFFCVKQQGGNHKPGFWKDFQAYIAGWSKWLLTGPITQGLRVRVPFPLHYSICFKFQNPRAMPGVFVIK
jgi:hypothetical protein